MTNTNTNLLARINQASDGARRVATRLLREANVSLFAGTVANIDDNLTKTGRPSREAKAMANEHGDLLSFIEHILTCDVDGKDEASGASGLSALACKMQRAPRGSVVVQVEAGVGGESFRERNANETWAEYGAAHQAWRAARD